MGAYRACQLFAFLPYQLLLSLTQVLFPMLARARVESPDAVREYVARGARLGAIAMGAMVAVIAGMPETAIRFAYDADTAARGAPALRVLALGQGGFAMLGIGCTVLSSLGRERLSAVLTACAAAVAAGACFVLVPSRAFGAQQLEATAWCMALTLGAALIVCGALVVRVSLERSLPWPHGGTRGGRARRDCGRRLAHSRDATAACAGDRHRALRPVPCAARGLARAAPGRRGVGCSAPFGATRVQSNVR